MRLYQVEICLTRCMLKGNRGRFQMVEAEDHDLARKKAREEYCGQGEDIFWIQEVPEEEAEALLV